ncbi:hypothetical protein UFOVP32_65 [uncultured Caudovirales phage]|uniref:Uncharacterized protein n=1 Tax=uncultured Caudovirales phage TaxID=2100421 RepID=A0A6J5KQJ1_9CAUD|nr:hypothetical protein UFOVP32_65 [uncultured Caudovirales phage]CAB4123555.1 hypothetical protein UFOVP50_11 [uncultured Caudovirales phage]
MPKTFSLEDLGYTDAIGATILAAGEAVGKAKSAAKPERKPLLADALKAVQAGVEPAPPTFPISNYWSQRHADKLFALMQAGDEEGLNAFPINGCNTYAKALRAYREICLTYLAMTPVIAFSSAKAKAKKPKAKMLKAPTRSKMAA